MAVMGAIAAEFGTLVHMCSVTLDTLLSLIHYSVLSVIPYL